MGNQTCAYLATHRHRQTGEYLAIFVPMDGTEFRDMLCHVCTSPAYEPDAAGRACLVDRLTAAFAIASDLVDVERVTQH